MKHLVAIASFVVTAHVHAAVVSTVIDVPTSAGPQRILEVRGDVVYAYIVSLAGGSGFYDIQPNGTMPSAAGTCSPPVRNMWDFAALGIAVVAVNSTSYKTDEILAYLRARHDVPAWITGGSSSTVVAASWAANIPLTVPLGLLENSPSQIDSALAASIRRPTLVIYHLSDGLAFGPELYDKLTAAPVRQLVALNGGISSECGYHLFAGLDAQYIAATAGFIDANNGALGGTAAGPSAVEYFNAGFGHYFMTSQSDEITGLDGGAFNGAFVRTGRSFRILDAPAPGTMPVCRFFTTPGTFGAKSSHFYTANQAECDGLKLNPNWIYEKIAFHIAVPVGGACAAGTVAVYRAYNHGQTGAPNHRFTTDLALYTQFITTQGWDAEGIAFCAPA